jgi:hypothetical protein
MVYRFALAARHRKMCRERETVNHSGGARHQIEVIFFSRMC